MTATETQALLAGGKITTDQIIQDHQARYQERDEKVKAWVCVNHTRAAKDAIKGDLNGVVVGIKDIFSTFPISPELMVDTKDFPTQHGSPFHTGESPGVDAPIVRILRTAGAHIIGKTVRHASPLSRAAELTSRQSMNSLVQPLNRSRLTIHSILLIELKPLPLGQLLQYAIINVMSPWEHKLYGFPHCYL